MLHPAQILTALAGGAGPIKTAIWEGSSSPDSLRDWEAYNSTDYGPVFAKTAKFKERWLQSPRKIKVPEDVAACCWKVCLLAQI